MEKVALLVLDGFGYSKKHEGNAVEMAKMPYYNKLLEMYPHSFLRASGEFVGLKKGQMGNSETGHMNIGAGRIVAQDLTKIDNSISSGEFYKNKVLKTFFEKIKKSGGVAHFVGLLSKGGIHSHMSHLFALIKMCKNSGVKDCYVHVITDGRDVDIHSAVNDVKTLQKLLTELSFGHIASIQGRFYAMDRDKKYNYTFDAYQAIINGIGIEINSPVDYLKQSYQKNITDEFIIPAVVVRDGVAVKFDNNKDGMLFYNFRKDRTKQLTEAFLLKDFDKFKTNFVMKNYVTMTSFGEHFDCPVVFEKSVVSNALVGVLSKNGKHIAKFSEPTKFPHVTYFLNGGREEPFENEDWFKVPAKNVRTFDEAPEMSAIEVANELVKRCQEKEYDFVMVNLANCDMVGHTGNIKATIKAIETVDKSLKIMVEFLKKQGYDILICADHGNAEQMIFRHKICTTHTNNPVRLVFVSKKPAILHNGTLVDISPTILSLYSIAYPKEWTGKNLVHIKK